MPKFSLELTLEDDDIARMERVCKRIGRQDWNMAVSWMVGEKLRELDKEGARIGLVCEKRRPMNRQQCAFCSKNPNSVPMSKARQRFSGFCSEYREKR